jgi:small-conductance mechanosensitive channel
MSNKAINFMAFISIVLTLSFTYVENIGNIGTAFGFASAGIAIAMKDGFMSIFGWLVMVFGGVVKSGDRIKVTMDGSEYVGDVLDISLLRITIQEDVTYTTFTKNRRAGRIIFVPNNYIFTNLIVNYSHYKLRTVWDGIDIVITFDSNVKKAMHIMHEITRESSKGFTNITRKHLGQLRDKYNLRNTNVEPRLFSFIDTYGIRLSVWYLTDAFATMGLRSKISIEIINAFQNEPDITIAYPTQSMLLHENNKFVREIGK